jgi:hypothetical protein
MEVARADVDAFLIDWITPETLKREWFFEQRDGGCRPEKIYIEEIRPRLSTVTIAKIASALGISEP